MGPVPLILAAASLAGAIFGGQRKHIDPAWLEQNFGAHAVSDEALQLFNSIINSPYGQHIMANATEQGQQFARDTNRQAAQAGLAGPEGTSGTGIFATSAAEGAGDSLQRGISSDFYQMVLPIAQQNVRDRMLAYINDFQGGGSPTDSAQMWQRIGTAAGTIGAMQKTGQTSGKTPSVTVDDIPSPPGGVGPSVNPGDFSPSFRLPSTVPVLPRYSARMSRFQGSFGSIQRGSPSYA